MGYMGFGMQNWIFRQRPRKPFSKERKPMGDTINFDKWDDLNIEGRTNRNPELAEKDIEEHLQEISNRRIKGKIYSGIILLFILSLIIVFIKFKPWEKYKDKGQYFTEEHKKFEEENKQAFQLSLNFGEEHFAKGEFELAEKEFITALKIFPENLEASVGLAKSYLQDCLAYQKNCEKAKSEIDKLIEKYPENPEYISYSISLGKAQENE
jgi:tetratricopeptide (TPR) repeat protein